jgi:pyridinium-3,5-biscarboxylic acid mononucleotide sulfurtransferase
MSIESPGSVRSPLPERDPWVGPAGPENAPLPASELLARLVAALDRHERLAVAVSGGVDSMTLAHVAWRFSGARARMYHATGPAVPAAARGRVEAHASTHGWPLVLLDAGEQADARYRANPVDRCYYCKTNLYARIREATPDPIASGTNRDDLDDFRPGLRAAAERDVVHPYVEAGIDKTGVYTLAAHLGLDDLERLPAQPCLASRVETGIAIAPTDLAFIDMVETRLAARLGGDAVLRCRVTHQGIVIELASAPPDADMAVASDIGAELCMAAGRAFAGVRPYVRGAAFLRRAGDG